MKAIAQPALRQPIEREQQTLQAQTDKSTTAASQPEGLRAVGEVATRAAAVLERAQAAAADAAWLQSGYEAPMAAARRTVARIGASRCCAWARWARCPMRSSSGCAR